MLPVVSSLKHSSPRPGLLDPSASPCDVRRPETGPRFQPGDSRFYPGIVGRDSGDFFVIPQKMLKKTLSFFFQICSWHFSQHVFFCKCNFVAICLKEDLFRWDRHKVPVKEARNRSSQEIFVKSRDIGGFLLLKPAHDLF